MIEILQGDSREVLAGLPAQSVHTCVTSPPYFGLRDYGTGQWEGGDPDCTHAPSGLSPDKKNRGAAAPNGKSSMRDAAILRGHCPCGAVRADHQIGLEETPDAYVQRLVEVFREVRRVLRDDGTLWLNLGDSYAANRSYQVPSTKGGPKHGPGQAAGGKASVVPEGLKPKDLIGIPWRVAFALQADGWYLRQDIIWHKPNPMPESVRDRCTKSHEYIFLLTKSPRYFFDHEAIKEPAVSDHASGNGFKRAARKSYQNADGSPRGNDEQWNGVGGKRNRRSVWTVTTKPFKGAHFAVFPPDLIEPCILAGSSQAGHCPECGERWTRDVRRVEADGDAAMVLDARKPLHADTYSRHRFRIPGGQTLVSGFNETVGWSPSCTCGVPSVPDIVLDPFFGAGTTGLVARQHGRRTIGVELNAEYIALARARLGLSELSEMTFDEGVFA